MRSADLLRVSAVLACLLLAACASAPAPENAAPAAASAKEGAAAGNGAGPALPVVSPAVVQAFDAALRNMQAGQDKEAEAELLALARDNPDLGGPHVNLGILYRRAGKLDKAIAELELAVQSNPKQPVYLNELGIAYRAKGQFSKAREAYEKALALDPSYPAPNLNLGILFDLYLWDNKKALDLYDRYLSLTPGGDATVAKWVADLKNRARKAGAAAPKEQP